MNNFVRTRENNLDILIDMLKIKIKSMNNSTRKCVEMELRGIHLALKQSVNLMEIYKKKK